MSHHRGKKTGIYRSRLEAFVAAKLKRLRLVFSYETTKYPYILEKVYTPDFFLADGTILEVKGVLMAPDRAKMVAVKKAHPDLDIVFVFAKPHKLCPGLKATHAEWASRHGFRWVGSEDLTRKDIKGGV